jgi:hypothetical protein
VNYLLGITLLFSTLSLHSAKSYGAYEKNKTLIELIELNQIDEVLKLINQPQNFDFCETLYSTFKSKDPAIDRIDAQGTIKSLVKNSPTHQQ